MFTITKWHTLVAALWISLGCGYWGTFGTFSPALVKRYDLAPRDLSTIGIGTTIVGFVTFTAGIYTDRVGVAAALVTGLLVNMLGWFLYGLIAIKGWRPMPPVVMFTGLAMFATYGAGLLTASVFKILTNNFTEGRSTVVGIAKAWVGFTTGFASTVFVGFYPSADDAPERLYFLWFLVANLIVFVLFPLPFMRIVNPDESGNLLFAPRSLIAFLSYVTLALISLTVFVAVMRQALSESMVFILSLILILLVILPWLSLLPRCKPQNNSEILASNLPEQSQAAQTLPASPWAGGPQDMAKRIEAWFLWYNVFALLAGGVVLTTNFGPITQSRSGAHVSSASIVSSFSSAQALGRFSGGAISDMVVQRKLPRPWYFVPLSMLMAGGHACLLIPGPAALYIGTLLAGYAFGSTYPLMIVVIVELFGAERISSNYMVYDGMPLGMASLLIAKSFSQWVYNQNGTCLDERDGLVKCTCTGESCFSFTFLFIIVLQVIGVVSACLLASRSAIVYRSSVFPTELQSSSQIQLSHANSSTSLKDSPAMACSTDHSVNQTTVS